MKTKIAEVQLFLESCMGLLQGGATLRTINAEGELINESIASTRSALTATYRRLVKAGAKGEVFTCHGKGSWITNQRHDSYN